MFGSLVTPPLHVDVNTTPRSAQRSLNFTTPRPCTDPVTLTSDPVLPSNLTSRLHSDPVPPMSDPVRLSNHSCPDVSRSPVASRRLQSPCLPHTDDSPRCVPHTDCSQPSLPHIEGQCDEWSDCRWSVSDYFQRYPDAAGRLESTVCYDTAAADSQSRRDRQLSRNDDDSSTVISSIHHVAHQSPSVVSSLTSLDSGSVTNHDAAFRAGLARLDANIARVQRRLQRSSTSSPTHTSPTRHRS